MGCGGLWRLVGCTLISALLHSLPYLSSRWVAHAQPQASKTMQPPLMSNLKKGSLYIQVLVP
eukprot:scaffold2353_cov167-Amphora_coffeaeformis.AAC.1